MCSGSGPFAEYLVLLMLSTFMVYGFPIQHDSSGNRLVLPSSKNVMTRMKDVPLRDKKELLFRDKVGIVKRIPDAMLVDHSGINQESNVIGYNTDREVEDASAADVLKEREGPDVRESRHKRCANCTESDDVTLERTDFIFDPLKEAETTDYYDDDFEEVSEPTNNSLIILPLMALIVFIGILCTKICRWTQKDVREVGFIVEAKPLKKNTIAKGIMQMHNVSVMNRANRNKKSKSLGMRAPEQFMFLPLLLGQSITVTSKTPNARARTPPKGLNRSGSSRLFHSRTSIPDPGFDGSEDTDEERPVCRPGWKRQSSSQPRETETRKSASPMRLESESNRGSEKRRLASNRDITSVKSSIDAQDLDLDSSEEERLELEERCRRGLAVLAHINPIPLAKKPSGVSLASRSSSGSTKAFSGQTFSVRAEIHGTASASTDDLNTPQEPHGSRHSSADACVDTHDLLEHIEDYYGVDIRAFIKLWNHRRRFANITDAVDLETAAAYARRHEVKRTQSCKKPKKPKPFKRQVSFPFDLPQSHDPESSPVQPATPMTLSRGTSTIDDEVFNQEGEIPDTSPLHERDSTYERNFEATIELANVGVADNPGSLEDLPDLPLSLTSSHHSICDDSGYHNHSFSRILALPPPGPTPRRTSSDDSAVATNLASESSHSNPDGSPQSKLNSPSYSDERRVLSLSLSDLRLKGQLNSQFSHETCANNSMQRTRSSSTLDDGEESSPTQGASNRVFDVHALENGVCTKSGHRPMLKAIANHANMATVSSNMSDDTEKLLSPTSEYNSDNQNEPRGKNSGSFRTGKAVSNCCQVGNHGDDIVTLGGDEARDEEVSEFEESSFDSSPNAPLLQNSIKISRDKSSDMENNNEHLL